MPRIGVLENPSPNRSVPHNPVPQPCQLWFIVIDISVAKHGRCAKASMSMIVVYGLALGSNLWRAALMSSSVRLVFKKFKHSFMQA